MKMKNIKLVDNTTFNLMSEKEFNSLIAKAKTKMSKELIKTTVLDLKSGEIDFGDGMIIPSINNMILESTNINSPTLYKRYVSDAYKLHQSLLPKDLQDNEKPSKENFVNHYLNNKQVQDNTTTEIKADDLNPFDENFKVENKEKQSYLDKLRELYDTSKLSIHTDDDRTTFKSTNSEDINITDYHKSNTIRATGTDLVEQAKLTVAMAKAKGWNLEEIRFTGSKQFIEACEIERESLLAELGENNTDTIETIENAVIYDKKQEVNNLTPLDKLLNDLDFKSIEDKLNELVEATNINDNKEVNSKITGLQDIFSKFKSADKISAIEKTRITRAVNNLSEAIQKEFKKVEHVRELNDDKDEIENTREIE